MRRGFFPFWRLLLFPVRLHIFCALVALAACVPILFPEIAPAAQKESIISIAGSTILSVQGVSTAFVVMAVITHMLRLSNTRAFSQLFQWIAVWSSAILFFILLAIAADVAPPAASDDNTPIQASDTLYTAREQLNGPASLVIPIETRHVSIDKVDETPHLIFLENNHELILKDYLNTSPRWSGQEGDDTFYTKPGHLVMVPPTTGGTPALVHVCFRSMVEGDPLPQGYTLITPGGSFPDTAEGATIPDMALDLGRNHFLLLAWRGSSHRETALRAINAAIAATDERMQPLRESPTQETARRMLQGRTSYPGNTPEFRLSEPLSQDGAYQGELYANPGEPGVFLVYIKDLTSNNTLRLLSFPAQYSDNPQELFRHDIPGSMPHWIRSSAEDSLTNIFPHNTPLFAIRLGPQRQYFGVAFEIWFKPSDVRKNRHLLLRRCYKVQAYDPPAGVEKQPDGSSDTPQA
ncbi:MAG: hypothetical protein IKY92_05375 [Akkermansia sp.]|nr:hypothetical protein [Akkermansia sp.]